MDFILLTACGILAFFMIHSILNPKTHDDDGDSDSDWLDNVKLVTPYPPS